jgi:F-type H+-transporting ATPase subunit b
MRIRRFVAAGVLAGALVVAVQAPAFADDPGKKQGKELVECTEKALSDNKAATAKKDYTGFKNALEDCKKAPSLITPALSEIIWGGIAFLIVAFLLMKFAFPMLKKTVKAREDKIRGDLEAAERARREAEEEKARFDAQLGDARAEGNRIIDEARQTAEDVRKDVVAKAEADAASIRAKAQDDARLATERALSDLQHRVGDLSIELAEKIVERNLDRDTQMALVESYISSVGNGGK